MGDDDDASDAFVVGLIHENPTARVLALSADGAPVPVPDGLPRPDCGLVIGRGAGRGLRFVLPEDQLLVVAAWSEALEAGRAVATVRLIDDPARPVRMHLVDLRSRFGVVLSVLTGCASAGAVAPVGAPALLPRVGLVRKDSRGLILDVDEPACRMLGLAAADLVGRSSLEFVHPDDQERALAGWMDMLGAAGSQRRTRVRHRTGRGWLWVELTNHNLLADDVSGCVAGEIVDVSQEVAATEALRDADRLLHRIAEALPVGILHVDLDRRVSYRNARLVQLLAGPASADFAEQFAQVRSADRARLADVLDRVLADGVDREEEVRLRAPGPTRYCLINVSALTAAQGEITGAILCVSDITDSVRLREQLEHRASYDVLTGCLNRDSMLAAVEAELGCAEAGRGVALIFIDLDAFKLVNDTHGHAAGDALLRELGNGLRRAARPGDAVGRIGGDEFLVACAGVPSLVQARRIAQRFERAVGAVRLQIGPHAVVPTAAFGVTWSTGGEDTDAVIARADALMYAEKARRGSRPAAGS